MAEPKLAKNFALLSAGETLSKVFTFIAFTFLSRALGPAVYGDLEFSIAAVTVFALFVQMGLGSYGAREIARQPARAQQLLSEIMAVRMWMGGLSVAFLLVFAATVDKSADVRLLIVAYGASLLVVPGMTLWFFQGHDAMHWVAAANLIRHGTFATCVFFFFRGDHPLWWIGVFETASVLASIGFGLWVVLGPMGFSFVIPRPAPRRSWEHLRAAGSIGLSNLAWALLWLSPVVLLGLRVDDASLGWFGASHRATMALHTFVWWYFFNLLPAISRTAGQPPEELRRLVGRSLSIVSWGSIFAALAGTLLAGPALGLAFGSGFFEGGPLLAALIWCIPIAAVGGHYRYMLIGYDLQHWLFVWTAVGAAVTMVGTYWLAPLYGAIAGAVSLVVGNLVCFGLCYITAGRRIQWIRFGRRLLMPAGAAVAAGGLALSLFADHRYVSAAAGIALYISLFFWAQRRELPVWRRQLSARLTGWGKPA